jgi:hypothetical protein
MIKRGPQVFATYLASLSPKQKKTKQKINKFLKCFGKKIFLSVFGVHLGHTTV